MEKISIQDEAKKMSVAERIILAQELWDSIVVDQENIELTKGEQDELERRLSEYQSSPDEGSSWSEVKARIEGCKCKTKS